MKTLTRISSVALLVTLTPLAGLASGNEPSLTNPRVNYPIISSSLREKIKCGVEYYTGENCIVRSGQHLLLTYDDKPQTTEDFVVTFEPKPEDPGLALPVLTKVRDTSGEPEVRIVPEGITVFDFGTTKMLSGSAFRNKTSIIFTATLEGDEWTLLVNCGNGAGTYLPGFRLDRPQYGRVGEEEKPVERGFGIISVTMSHGMITIVSPYDSVYAKTLMESTDGKTWTPASMPNYSVSSTVTLHNGQLTKVAEISRPMIGSRKLYQFWSNE